MSVNLATLWYFFRLKELRRYDDFQVQCTSPVHIHKTLFVVDSRFDYQPQLTECTFTSTEGYSGRGRYLSGVGNPPFCSGRGDTDQTLRSGYLE